MSSVPDEISPENPSSKNETEKPNGSSVLHENTMNNTYKHNVKLDKSGFVKRF